MKTKEVAFPKEQQKIIHYNQVKGENIRENRACVKENKDKQAFVVDNIR